MLSGQSPTSLPRAKMYAADIVIGVGSSASAAPASNAGRIPLDRGLYVQADPNNGGYVCVGVNPRVANAGNTADLNQYLNSYPLHFTPVPNTGILLAPGEREFFPVADADDLMFTGRDLDAVRVWGI